MIRDRYIERITVEKLFGRYNYTLEKTGLENADPRYFILYGDNGTGKTTVLKLLFTLLSSNEGRGEKSYIGRTPFRRFRVDFTDGASIEAARSIQSNVGDFVIRLQTGPGDSGREISVKTEERFAVKRGTEGSTNTIYLELLTRLAEPEDPGTQLGDINRDIIPRLRDLASRSAKYAEHGVVHPISADRFVSALSSIPSHRQFVVSRILQPFLDALDARLDAVKRVYDSISTYLEIINSFYQDKHVSFAMDKGVVVETSDGDPLDPDILSSGEKQLMLLLSQTMLASAPTTIFIIDEPELSLNVKWQRKLLDALASCAATKRVQYVLATHSLELLASHLKDVARLQVMQK